MFEAVVGVSWSRSFYFSRNGVEETAGEGQVSHLFAMQVSTVTETPLSVSSGDDSGRGDGRCRVVTVSHSARLLHPILNLYYTDFTARKIRSLLKT